jgi:L-threo-3-deoxy-hexylosonate aldolase
MVVPPGYYAGALLSDTRSIRDFFVQIAEASPVPVLALAGSVQSVSAD